MLHEVLLAGWGCPIGELFDLEALSVQCKKSNRYSFFVASEPCNVRFPTLHSHDKIQLTTKVPGGVASPPNIIAIQ
jgi:hypothetical protein